MGSWTDTDQSCNCAFCLVAGCMELVGGQTVKIGGKAKVYVWVDLVVVEVAHVL